MSGVRNKSAPVMRVVVKLPAEQYNDLFRHVNAIGSTMSAFFRESAKKAMNEAGLEAPTASGDGRV